LSRIYREQDGDPEAVFLDKEVLLKVITLVDNSSHENKVQLIDEISHATNKQTAVINADRFANEDFHLKIQKKVFDRYGLLYERKRGEFSDGLQNGYIDGALIIERNQFLRIFYAANGHINRGSRKRLFQKNEFPDFNIDDDGAFDMFFLGLHVLRALIKDFDKSHKIGKEVYAKVFIYNQLFISQEPKIDEDTIRSNLGTVEIEFERFIQGRRQRSDYPRRIVTDRTTGEQKISYRDHDYYTTSAFEDALASHFANAPSNSSCNPNKVAASGF